MFLTQNHSNIIERDSIHNVVNSSINGVVYRFLTSSAKHRHIALTLKNMSNGLPKPVSGCPWSEGILWREGWRSQGTFGIQTNNSRSPEFHLDGKVNSNKVKRSFCIKYRMTSDRNRPPWPKGGLQFVLMKIFAAQHLSSIYAHC